LYVSLQHDLIFFIKLAHKYLKDKGNN